MDIDTPAAVVDVARLERNLARWQAECDRIGLANRPHVKAHKCVGIARRQLELGAVGLTCQKLGEAETMVDAGFDDVLVPYNLVGPRKLERLSALLARATITVSVDDAALLDGLARAAAAAGRELAVLVDCDTGLLRTGVGDPRAAAALAGRIRSHDGAPVRGVPHLSGVARRACVLRASRARSRARHRVCGRDTDHVGGRAAPAGRGSTRSTRTSRSPRATRSSSARSCVSSRTTPASSRTSSTSFAALLPDGSVTRWRVDARGRSS